jgi:hypothetical protein
MRSPSAQNAADPPNERRFFSDLICNRVLGHLYLDFILQILQRCPRHCSVFPSDFKVQWRVAILVRSQQSYDVPQSHPRLRRYVLPHRHRLVLVRTCFCLKQVFPHRAITFGDGLGSHFWRSICSSSTIAHAFALLQCFASVQPSISLTSPTFQPCVAGYDLNILPVSLRQVDRNKIKFRQVLDLSVVNNDVLSFRTRIFSVLAVHILFCPCVELFSAYIVLPVRRTILERNIIRSCIM